MRAIVFVFAAFFLCLCAGADPSSWAGRALLRPLPLGSILPRGWLQTELTLQAQGLAGHLADFYKFVNQSVWVGGPVADPYAINERVPYQLNGLVPLAALTGDAHTAAQVEVYLNYILDHQTLFGWFGPLPHDPWPRYPLMMALAQYVEAHPANATRIVPAMLKFIDAVEVQIMVLPLSSWSKYRWQDLCVVTLWMIQRAPDAATRSRLGKFWDRVQAQGFDWESFFVSPAFPRGSCKQFNTCGELSTHGVNVGQALKVPAVKYLRDGNYSGHLQAAEAQWALLDQFHGQSSGMFSCSENLGMDWCMLVAGVCGT